MNCKACGCGFLSPRIINNEIERAYRGYHTHDQVPTHESSELAAWRKLWARLRNGYLNHRFDWRFEDAHSIGRFLIPLVPGRKTKCAHHVRHFHLPDSGGNLLDIGCGAGGYLNFASQGGWQVAGIEPDPDAAKTARESGLLVKNTGLPDTGFPGLTFDAVLLNHVIEHVHDPLIAMQEVNRLLKPGGVATVITPNIESWSHQIYKQDWRGLEPPRHLVLFNRESIKKLCERAGLEIVGCYRSPPNARYYFWMSDEISRTCSNRRPRGKLSHRWLQFVAFLFDCLSRAWSFREEEIVLTIRKPHSQGANKTLG